MRRAAVVALGVWWIGCSASAFQSRDVELDKGGQKISIRDESGAIIVGKRQVGKFADGKVMNSRGQPLAFVYDDYVQLKGGVQVPIKTDADGAMYFPEGAQAEAGLVPMTERVRADGRVASTEGAQGVASSGTGTADKRRLLLVVLLITANALW